MITAKFEETTTELKQKVQIKKIKQIPYYWTLKTNILKPDILNKTASERSLEDLYAFSNNAQKLVGKM